MPGTRPVVCILGDPQQGLNERTGPWIDTRTVGIWFVSLAAAVLDYLDGIKLCGYIFRSQGIRIQLLGYLWVWPVALL